ncbi:MAG TPA: hypothetical protein DCM68_05655 [Verrucomicrobia bacterium]|nr:hypothetical protein [Verrucomicrobiota bacterium]
MAWLALACAAGAQAQVEPLRPGKPGRAAIYSADRRFMVSGMTSAENMVLARKLSEQADKVEKQTGMPLPMQRGQVLGVMVQSSSSPGAQVLKVQGWDDGHFYQRLVVPGTVRLDEEDLLEGACWLLLNRYAAEYTPAGQRTGMGATVPDWISAGLVQNSQAALRSRNRDWISREIGEGRTMPLAQVVKLETLPPGRWREKAYAAAAVEFLFPDGDLDAWAALFKAVGTRQPVDAAWLRAHSRVLRDRKPEEAWREHLDQRARSRHAEAWGDRSLQVEEKLLQTLNFRPRDLAEAIPEEVPQEMFARELVEYRGQPWTVPVAASLSLQVQSLELGAVPALRGVLASYAAFFDQLGMPPPQKHSWWRRPRAGKGQLRPPDDATWQVALNQLWLRAERAHQDFLESHQTRKRYVDSFDRPVADDFAAPPPASSGLPRTRWQNYVDEAEDRLTSP